MDVTVSPFDLLYGASADPQVARELGLAALDIDDPGGIYDYAVEAGFATLWAQWVLQPRIARERADRLRAELAGRPAEWKDRREFAPFSIASLITGLEQADAVSIEAPADLRVDVVPDATRQPVQARVRVHWARGAATLFEAPDRVRMLHAFARASDGGDVLLHHRDDENKLLAPHLPTPYGEPEARFNLVDRAVPSYGEHIWKITAMDLFGRVSPAAAISTDVRDTIPPPAPGTVDVRLLGNATTGPSWTAVVIAFDWLPAHEAIAPDLAAFELHLRQGVVSSADAPLPTSWGRFETTPGSVAGAVRIAWPGLAVSNLPTGVTVTPSSAPIAGGGTRITITTSPIAIPFDAIGYAHIAAAIRAVDVWDNSERVRGWPGGAGGPQRSASALVRRAGAKGDATRRPESLLVQRAASGHGRCVGASAALHQRGAAGHRRNDRRAVRGARRSSAGRPASRAERAPSRAVRDRSRAAGAG